MLVTALSLINRVHVVITREGPIVYFKVVDPSGTVQLQQAVQAKSAADFDGIYALRVGLLQVWLGAGSIRTIYIRAAGQQAIAVLVALIAERGCTSLTEAMNSAQIEYTSLRDQSEADGDSSITLIGSGTADGTVGHGMLERLEDSIRSVYNQIDYNANTTHELLKEVPDF